MINTEQSIPCPVCNTKICFDTKQLLMGVKFVCPTCQAAIGLANESKPLLKDTMEKFESIKDNMTKK